MTVGLFSSISSAFSSIGLRTKPDTTRAHPHFKGFDTECERLRNVDLEAPVRAEHAPKPQVVSLTRRSDGNQS